MSNIIKSIPGAATVLLDFLSGPESRGDYEAWSSFKQRNLPKPLTKMTLREVLECQRNWKKYGGISSAAGRYQIIRKTLESLIKKLGLSLDLKFDAKLQDYLGYHLLRGRGYDQWITGNLSDGAFGNNLAKEWASLPVLSNIKNYKGVWISAGTSYYAGDGLNSHGVTVQQVHDALHAAKNSPAAVAVEEVKVKDVAKPVIAIGAAAATAGGGIVASLPDLDTVVGYVDTFRPVVELISSNFGATGLAAAGVGVVAYFVIRYFTKK